MFKMGRRAVILFTLIVLATPVLAFRMHGSKNPNAKKGELPQKWEGQYNCEQCNSANSTVGDVKATANPCWKYNVEIYLEGKELLGHVRIQGSDGITELRASISGNDSLIEFHNSESLNRGASTTTFASHELLFTLEHRDDDLLLRFRSMQSKVKDQAVLICQGNPKSENSK